MDPSPPWAAYARAQAELAGRQVVDSWYWGLEAGLACLIGALTTSPNCEALDRAVRTESRGERHRMRLRRIHFTGAEGQPEPESQFIARRRLEVLRAMVSEADWLLLIAVGEGRDYGEIASGLGVTPGSLRVRVLRLRRELQGRNSISEPSRRAA
jgi:hypothetical protein